MAKKKKTKPIAGHNRLTVRRSIEDQVEAMILRAEWLRDEGRTEAAKRMLVRIERLVEELKGLE